MRSDLTRRAPNDVKAVFGPDSTGASEHAGALWIGDANLVCLPVRSVVGTFAWVTSPFLLGRFLRDAKEAGVANIPDPLRVQHASICLTTTSTRLKEDTRVYFEDLDFQTAPDANTESVANWIAGLFFDDEFWRAHFRDRFCVVHDDVMTYLSTHGTDVVNRIRLENATKTVAKGALWSEESLPTESLLSSLVVVAPLPPKTKDAAGLEAVLRGFSSKALQLGGDATIGRGRCMLRVASGGAR